MCELDLETVLNLTDEDAFRLSAAILEEYFGKIHSDDNSYVFAMGENPICLVAHADTLRNGIPVKLAQSGDYIINMNGVLGADDRAGIYIIFRILSECTLKRIKLPSVLITSKEETGLIGSKNFVNSKWFLNTGAHLITDLIINLDYRGHKKFVTYGKNIPNIVENYVQNFGFVKSKSKGKSDTVVLSYAYPSIPCVNLSVGYEYEHTSKERLHVDNYIDSFQRVLKMIQSPLYLNQSDKKDLFRADSIRLRKKSRKPSNSYS